MKLNNLNDNQLHDLFKNELSEFRLNIENGSFNAIFEQMLDLNSVDNR